MYGYQFTEAEATAAWEQWGCNCGPTALAFVLRLSLDKVRPLIPDFEKKRYTSPTMMRAALRNAGVAITEMPCGLAVSRANLFGPLALVRLQWSGPWTAPGAHPKWAYRYTHWIATWADGAEKLVFDCNGGIRPVVEWEREIVPLILAQVARSDGYYFPTHIWRVAR